MVYEKIYTIAIFFTSIFVFTIWVLIGGSIYVDGADQKIYTVLLGIVFSYGFFGLFTNIILLLLNKSTKIRKIVLGPTYFEGTWVGYYMATENTPVIFFQIIQQSIDDINITTEAYHIDRRYRCSWWSVSKVSADPRTLKLYYMYEIDKMVDENEITIGIFNSNFLVNKKWGISNPCRINGYAFNLHSKEKVRVQQIKLRDTISIVNDDCIDVLVKKALEFYHRDISNLKTAQIDKSIMKQSSTLFSICKIFKNIFTTRER